MKKFVFALITVLSMTNLMAQTNPNNETIYKEWELIGESESMIEVSARVLKCNSQSVAQMHVEIFNESSNDQTAHFKITLTNPATNAQEVHTISLAVVKGAIVKPNCENNDFSGLRINIPSNWDPAKVKIALTFIP